MKRIFLSLMIVLFSSAGFAQLGIENVIVEKYYISAAGDAPGAGYTTYRVWVDLATGPYKLLNAYGNAAHPLDFTTTTAFYNDANGATLANGIGNSVANLSANATLLDSWISLGAAANGRVGVLKSNDATSYVNGLGYLQNADAAAGIPISTSDGIINGPTPAPATVGLDSPVLDNFDFGFTGNQVLVNNGSWAFTAGTKGVGTQKLVLVAQVTTNGYFSFHMNFIVKDTVANTSEKFVWSNPNTGAGEVTAPFLSYSQNQLPSISWVLPAAGASFGINTNVNMEVSQSDPDGTISKVTFWVDGVLKSVVTSPVANATYSWLADTYGAHTLKATATDNNNDSVSVTRNITVDNVLPVVNFSMPTVLTYTVGETVTLTASATDTDGTIASISLLEGTTTLTTVANPATAVTSTWVAAGVGNHTLTASATDNGGATVTQIKTIVVSANPATVFSNFVPVSGSVYAPSAAITVGVDAVDANGINQVEFFLGATSIGTTATAPYSAATTAPLAEGTYTLTAVATDGLGVQTTSAAWTFDVVDPNGAGWEVVSDTLPCTEASFCLSIQKRLTALSAATGFDMVIKYNNTKVTPTGAVTIFPYLMNVPAYASASVNIVPSLPGNTTYGEVYVSIYLNPSAPVGTTFNSVSGADQRLFCLGFVKNATFGPTDTAQFRVRNFVESYQTSTINQRVNMGWFKSYVDSTLYGSLRFWNGYDPMSYVSGTNLPTTIQNVGGTVHTIYPNAGGEFEYNTAWGNVIDIIRDIPQTSSVMSVINGNDAYLTKKVLIEDLSFIPSVFQLIAMDVNRDGVVSAGDLSQMNLRTVMKIKEFTQAGNLHKDWVFVDSDSLTASMYIISATYPANDGAGYSKFKVPYVAQTKTISIVNSVCSAVDAEDFLGVMLGDVDGNYKDIPASTILKATEAGNNGQISLQSGLTNENSDYIDVPVSVSAEYSVHAADFGVQYNNSILKFESIVNLVDGVETFANYSSDDATLRVTSFGLSSFLPNQPLFSLRFSVTGNLNNAMLQFESAYLNGEPVSALVTGSVSGIQEQENKLEVSIHPNPAKDIIHITMSENADAQLFNMFGQIIMNNIKIYAGQELSQDVSNLANGVYFLKAWDGHSMVSRRIVINK